MGLSGNMSIRNSDRSEDLNYQYSNQPTLGNSSFRNSRQFEDDLGYDLNFDFRHQFKRSGEELTANASYGNDKEDGTNDFVQVFSGPKADDGRKKAQGYQLILQKTVYQKIF